MIGRLVRRALAGGALGALLVYVAWASLSLSAQQCRLAWDRHLIRCWSCLASHTRSLQA